MNNLHRQFDIPRDRVETFSQIFVENLKFLNAFNSSDSFRSNMQQEVSILSSDTIPARTPERIDTREFLDSCFVIMPFGSYFDKYYKDIYTPSIKKAGLEPYRADELFSTGSVVEQIWDQIKKAKLVLADLTDRNPNVFYELGLAHAASKPVVLTAQKLDDVPFDLRHLRVIIYDVRDPHWSKVLFDGVCEYLKNAVKDPAKSLPSPFRHEAHARHSPDLSEVGDEED